jgi:hypothetical protein
METVSLTRLRYHKGWTGCVSIQTNYLKYIEFTARIIRMRMRGANAGRIQNYIR